ncbi:hypothetical protein D3C75_1364990 [compost metagenome]
MRVLMADTGCGACIVLRNECISVVKTMIDLIASRKWSVSGESVGYRLSRYTLIMRRTQ